MKKKDIKKEEKRIFVTKKDSKRIIISKHLLFV